LFVGRRRELAQLTDVLWNSPWRAMVRSRPWPVRRALARRAQRRSFSDLPRPAGHAYSGVSASKNRVCHRTGPGDEHKVTNTRLSESDFIDTINWVFQQNRPVAAARQGPLAGIPGFRVDRGLPLRPPCATDRQAWPRLHTVSIYTYPPSAPARYVFSLTQTGAPSGRPARVTHRRLKG
jgi:hypothetical protein